MTPMLVLLAVSASAPLMPTAQAADTMRLEVWLTPSQRAVLSAAPRAQFRLHRRCEDADDDVDERADGR